MSDDAASTDMVMLALLTSRSTCRAPAVPVWVDIVTVALLAPTSVLGMKSLFSQFTHDSGFLELF